MTTARQDRFAPMSRENPAGYLTREFTLTAERVGEGEQTALRIAISSEAPVERYDWSMRDGDGYYDEVLDHGPDGPDLSYVKDGIPFLLDHRLSAQIGIGTTPVLGEDRVLRTDVVPGNHPDAAWVFADMLSGVRKKVSIGYWPGTDYTQSKDETTGRIRRVYRGWGLYEASTVVVPADYNVGVGRSARGATAPAAADHAAGDKPQTKESSMTAVTTPEPGTAPAPDTRMTELTALAREWQADETVGPLVQSRLADWLHAGTSVNDARSEVMRKLAEKAKAQPAIDATTPAAAVRGMHDRAEDKPWGATPEEMAREFTRAVITAARSPHATDVRLLASRAQNTVVGTEGGFAVPDAVNTMLLDAAKTGGELLSRVTTRPITTGNALKETVVQEEARTNGSRNGGLMGYWVAEQGEIPTTQAKLREAELALKKLAVAVPVTEEQIEDGPALLSFLREQVPEELRFCQELAIWSGNAVGKPQGALTSGALVTVAIQSGQTIANTAEHIWDNVWNMATRISPRSFLRSAWFVQQSLWAKIGTATAGARSNGAAPLYVAPGALAQAPYGMLLGRPIVPIEYASAEGTVGDLVLADFSDYLFATKGGLKHNTSMHVEFLKDKQMLKWTLRCDGQPRTRVPLTPFTGSATISPYVALAARS